MLPQKRIESLQRKKSQLAKKIKENESLPSVDEILQRHLKKQKLQIGEIIAGIRVDQAIGK